MRGQRRICLAYRNASTPQFPLVTTKRAYWPKPTRNTPNGKLYLVSDLVLDLDAADCEFVTPYEDLQKEGLESTELQNPSSAALSSSKPGRQARLQRQVGLELKSELLPVSIRGAQVSITPPDVLAYALKGSEIGETSTSPTRIGDPDSQAYLSITEILRSAGISSKNSDDCKVQFMAASLSSNHNQDKLAARFGSSNTEQISKELTDTQTLQGFRRAISDISSTPEGCRFLAKNNRLVGSNLVRLQKMIYDPEGSGRNSNSDALKILNNLHRNMDLRGLAMGRRLCSLAMSFAADAGNLVAVKMYMDMVIRSDESPKQIRHTLLQTLTTLHWICRGVWKDDDKKRNAALALITGGQGGIKPSNNRDHRSSIHSILYSQLDGYESHFKLQAAYLVTLGELGLRDLLWTLWIEEPHISIRGAEHENFRAQLFAHALLIAGDTERASLVLSVVTTTPASLDEPTYHHHDKVMRFALETHYCNQNVRIGPDLLSKVAKTVSSESSYNVPQGPDRSLESVQQFIVPQLLEAVASSSSHTMALHKRVGEGRLCLDWGVIDGHEGILLKDGNAVILNPSDLRSAIREFAKSKSHN